MKKWFRVRREVWEDGDDFVAEHSNGKKWVTCFWRKGFRYASPERYKTPELAQEAIENYIDWNLRKQKDNEIVYERTVEIE